MMRWKITKMTTQPDGQTACHFEIFDETETEEPVEGAAPRIVTVTTPLLVTQVLLSGDADEKAVLAAVEAAALAFADRQARDDVHPLQPLVGRIGEVTVEPAKRG